MSVNFVAAFHQRRYYVFATYEKHGYDVARDIARATSNTKWRNGLEAELLFYHSNRKDMNLEPLLDAGVKADFGGMIAGKPSNVDVTTNLAFKQANEYADVLRRRGRPYHIALTNLKTEEVELIPIRFPFCSSCGRLAHYLLFLAASDVEAHAAADFSDDQRLVAYCPSCCEVQEKASFSYLIPHLGSTESDLIDYATETEMYTRREVNAKVKKGRVRLVKFFETESNLLLSGLAENAYVITDPRDGDGYWAGELYWKHPLAKDLGKHVNVMI
jgi:hypothetical protein